MNIVFRCDSSINIGTGHVVRCLTLADALSKYGAKSHFICRDHDGNLVDFVRQRGYRVTTLINTDKHIETQLSGHQFYYSDWLGVNWSEDATDTLSVINDMQVDCLIVDHYAIDHQWEKKIQHIPSMLMVIDDLANRKHSCNVLLDPNLGRTTKDYEPLTPRNCKMFIGPKYALLREEFAKARSFSLTRRLQPQIKKIIISMGGIDKNNATSKILTAMSRMKLPKSLAVTVVMGKHSPWLEQVQQEVNNLPFDCNVIVDAKNMAKLMADADLAIGAAGSTAWERCCLGLPSIQFVLAENQSKISRALSEINAAINSDEETFQKIFLTTIKESNMQKLKELSQSASHITEGRGAELVADFIQRSIA